MLRHRRQTHNLISVKAQKSQVFLAIAANLKRLIIPIESKTKISLVSGDTPTKPTLHLKNLT
jgi:hypothetical protein